MKVKKYASQDIEFFKHHATEIAAIDDDESLLSFIDDCLESGELIEHTGKFFRVVIALKYALDGPRGFRQYTLMDKHGAYTSLELLFDDDPDWFDDFEDDLSAGITPKEILINSYEADASMRGIVDLVKEIIDNCESGCEWD